MKEIRVEKLALLTVMAYYEGAYVISGMLDRGCFTAVFWVVFILYSYFCMLVISQWKEGLTKSILYSSCGIKKTRKGKRLDWKIKVLPPISRMPPRVVPTPTENLWFRKLTWWGGFTAVFDSTGVFFNQLSCFLISCPKSLRLHSETIAADP